MKRIARLALCSLAAMIITACGGGGGGGGGPAAPTGPVVVSTTPAKDATGVPTATKVSATFSVPVADMPFTNLSSSVPPGFKNLSSVFTLKNPSGALVPGTMAVVPNTNNAKWEFTPDASLAVGTKYTATFKKGPGGVTDRQTPPNNMAADYVWSFTTSAWNGNQMLGTIVDDKAYGVATDSAGNIYVTGYTNNGLDGVLNADNTATGGTTADAFLVKYDKDGVKQWTRLLGATGLTPAERSCNDVANGIVIDNTSAGGPYIYIAGYTNGTVDTLDPNPAPGTTYNWFVAKYDTNGNPAVGWPRQSGTVDNNRAYGVALDAAGNVYIAGETGTTAAATSGDVFVTQISPAGVAMWTKTLASAVAANERAYGVAVNGANVYVAGYTNGVLTGTPGGTTNQGGADVFVAQFDTIPANAAPTWVRQLGTAGTDVANAVVADATGVYLAGTTFGSLDGVALVGTSDAFLVKYDTAGAKQGTARHLGVASADTDAFGITLDASGNIYITGDTFGVLDATTTNKGLADLYLAKFPAAGAASFVRQLGSVQDDIGYAVTFSNPVGGTPSLLVTGYTYGTLPGVNVHFNNADPTGNTADFFLTKCGTDGVLFQ